MWNLTFEFLFTIILRYQVYCCNDCIQMIDCPLSYYFFCWFKSHEFDKQPHGKGKLTLQYHSKQFCVIVDASRTRQRYISQVAILLHSCLLHPCRIMVWLESWVPSKTISSYPRLTSRLKPKTGKHLLCFRFYWNMWCKIWPNLQGSHCRCLFNQIELTAHMRDCANWILIGPSAW